MRNFIKNRVARTCRLFFLGCGEEKLLGDEKTTQINKKINKLASFTQIQVSFPALISYLQI
jgi:hypothetical protein